MPVEKHVESQLRDMAILAIIGLLFVLELQVLRLTSGPHKRDRTRR